MSGKKNAGKYALVSAGDLGKVIGSKWGIWDIYASSRADGPGKMHHVIIGDRPKDVPEDWVVDHANRDPLDNRRTNLQWTSRLFNSWNTPIKGASRYKGVGRNSQGTWTANFLKAFLGNFKDERAAGWVVARAAIATFPWAETNDLITCNFSNEEIQQMKREGCVPRPPRTLPKGVIFIEKLGKFRATHKHKPLGYFTTCEEAHQAYLASVKRHHDSAWSQHIKTAITYDKDGHAVIRLSGDVGKGMYTKVPERFWHLLTFKSAWTLSKRGTSCYAIGTWEKKTAPLHAAVWKLLHPDYVKVKGISIDHRNPANTLDNREENLRLGTLSGQARNQVNRGAGRYRGVHFDKRYNIWFGAVKVGDKRYCTKGVKSENEAARLLNALRIEVLGPDADLNVIFDD
jgi:hypothetical protein